MTCKIVCPQGPAFGTGCPSLPHPAPSAPTKAQDLNICLWGIHRGALAGPGSLRDTAPHPRPRLPPGQLLPCKEEEDPCSVSLPHLPSRATEQWWEPTWLRWGGRRGTPSKAGTALVLKRFAASARPISSLHCPPFLVRFKPQSSLPFGRCSVTFLG